LLQEQALAQARLQFEREQEAAKGALRSFAPGFGAGKLLADAMARRTAKVTAFANLHAHLSCTILSTACTATQHQPTAALGESSLCCAV